MEKEDKAEGPLSAVENFAGRRFRYSPQIEKLLRLGGMDAACPPKLEELFFLSKFVSNSWKILDRLGDGAGETEKMKNEFLGNLGKIQKLLGELVPGDDSFSPFLNVGSAEAMNELRDFIYELSWIQNYKIDRKVKH